MGRNMVAAVIETAMYQNCLKLKRYEPCWLERASSKATVRLLDAVDGDVVAFVVTNGSARFIAVKLNYCPFERAVLTTG
jgi:hypothetical protein